MAVICKLPQSGGKAKPNLFTQTTEPKNKNGIWINTNLQHKRVVIDSSVYTAGSFIQDPGAYFPNIATANGKVELSLDKTIVNNKIRVYWTKRERTLEYMDYDPVTGGVSVYSYGLSGGKGARLCVVTDTCFYLFGGTDNGGEKLAQCYRVDISAGKITQTAKADMPEQNGGELDLHLKGVHIYLYMKGNTYANVYRYDISANAYTKVTSSTSARHTQYTTTSVLVGDCIYAFGTSMSSYPRLAYRINVIEGTYTNLPNLPIDSNGANGVAVGTDIYLVLGKSTQGAAKALYKYSTLNNTYTKICDITWVLNGIYKSVVYKNHIFFSNNVFALQSKQYKENDLVILRTDECKGTYATQMYGEETHGNIYGRLKSGFDDVWLFHGGDLDQRLPTCYGDGTKWIKIKN